MRAKQREKTAHWDLVPTGHTCNECGGNKNTVNFYVSINKATKTINYVCNGCSFIQKQKKVKGVRQAHRIIAYHIPENIMKTFKVKYDIKHQIEIYFLEDTRYAH